ncbi:MAG: hypothetical protein K0R84_2712 [Clostridia bacterium]|nr:hypothetical protein [Clostridia bacterium]
MLLTVDSVATADHFPLKNVNTPFEADSIIKAIPHIQRFLASTPVPPIFSMALIINAGAFISFPPMMESRVRRMTRGVA